MHSDIAMAEEEKVNHFLPRPGTFEANFGDETKHYNESKKRQFSEVFSSHMDLPLDDPGRGTF